MHTKFQTVETNKYLFQKLKKKRDMFLTSIVFFKLYMGEYALYLTLDKHVLKRELDRSIYLIIIGDKFN